MLVKGESAAIFLHCGANTTTELYSRLSGKLARKQDRATENHVLFSLTKYSGFPHPINCQAQSTLLRLDAESRTKEEISRGRLQGTQTKRVTVVSN
jgi:hypothetical protein